jgi:putative transposase
MKGTRHSEEQIIAILKQGEAGLTTAESCRQHGITEQTCYRWKAKYGGMDSGEGKRRPLLQTSSPLKPKHQPKTYIGIGTANGGTSHRLGRSAQPCCGLDLLEPRLGESHTAVNIPFDDSVYFVSLLNCAEFSSRLSKVAQALDATSRAQLLVGGRGFGEWGLLGAV